MANELFYRVQVVKYGWIVVEAKDPEDAIKIAEMRKGDIDADDVFEDSEIDVHACESYPTDIDEIRCKEDIYSKTKTMRQRDYYEKWKMEDEDRKEAACEQDR